MDNDFSRALIEGIVRRSLRNMKDSPERSIRNLIDMALNFSEGQFQRSFFESMQNTLRNEKGAYYGLIRDMAVTIDPDRLLSFGMNLGYNSCTMGAHTIREIEGREGYNIPWSIALELDGTGYAQHTDAYHDLIKQGKALGVFTWLLISAGQPVEFLDLIKTNSDCAFLLFCKPEEITQSFLDEVQSIHNLMFVVRCEPEAVQACDHLREREYLYSIYIPYRSEEASSIVNEDILSTAENLHPVFTFFTPGEPSCEEQQKAVYQQVLQVRASQQYQTILIDLIYDNRAIDGVISDDSCEVEFRKDGTLYAPDTTGRSALSLFEQPLENILRCAFPKTT